MTGSIQVTNLDLCNQYSYMVLTVLKILPHTLSQYGTQDIFYPAFIDEEPMTQRGWEILLMTHIQGGAEDTPSSSALSSSTLFYSCEQRLSGGRSPTSGLSGDMAGCTLGLWPLWQQMGPPFGKDESHLCLQGYSLFCCRIRTLGLLGMHLIPSSEPGIYEAHNRYFTEDPEMSLGRKRESWPSYAAHPLV